MKAAREVVSEYGFESASVNEVVRRAGGSLATLYAQFGSKDGLVLAVLKDNHERFIASMAAANVDHLPLEEALTAIGENFVREVMKPETLAMYRVATSEGRKLPPDMRRDMIGSINQVVTVIVRVLKQHRVPAEDYEHAASFLFGLWLSRHHYRALADATYTISDEQICAHVAEAVRLFLHGVLRSA